MSEPLVSSAWHRVADLRPTLVPGLRIVRQRVREQVWHVLVEPASGRQVRLNPAAYALVARFDGQATVAGTWERQLARLGDGAPTQDEVLRLLAQLFRGGLLRFDAAPHLSLLFARRADDARQRRRGMVNPLAMRMPLADPARVLQALAPLGRWLFQPITFLLWCAAVLIAGLAAGAHAPELAAETRRLFTTPSSYVVAWLAYPVVKLLHEFGHGLAVRRFGGEVRELGVSVLFLTPAPYVDASAANAFEAPRQRLAVSAAGILVELGLACLALALWLAVAPGAVRDAALVVLLICSVSTVLFNANPLMRLDGYYALCDALQLPNLGQRSQAWWARRWREWVGGRAAGAAPLLARGEAKWLVAYAPLSLLYRLLLLLSLVVWIGQHSWMLGWLVALGLLAWAARGAWRWASATAMAGTGLRARSVRLATGVLAGALVLLFVVPVSDQVVTRGVVWPPDDAQLRAGAGGFVERLAQPQGSRARSGDTLLVLHDPVLGAAHQRLQAERRGLLAQQYSALLSQPARAAELAEDLERNAAETARTEQQLEQLQVRAKADGEVVWARPQDLPGSFVERGTMLGHVLAGGPAHVRLALPEDEFLRTRGQVRSIEVRLADSPSTVHQAALSSATPGATLELPSAALGDRHGGPIPVDAGDSSGTHARVPVFLLDAALPQVSAIGIGGRAWVKLVLPPKPLALQWVAQLQRLFIKQFNPTGQA